MVANVLHVDPLPILGVESKDQHSISSEHGRVA